MEIRDIGELDDDNDPYLPFNIRVLDARDRYNSRSTGESLYITQDRRGRLHLSARIFNYEVDWTTLFEVNREEADEIVNLGYANWYWGVKLDDPLVGNLKKVSINTK